MYHLFKWSRASLSRNDLTRHYEPMQPHLLITLARQLECDVFVDVGSNVGAYALLMSTVPTMTSIHAFEPSPDTFVELQANVALNDVHIHLHNLAVSDREGVLTFGIINALSGANSVVSTSLHSNFVDKVEVKSVRLDDVLSFVGKRLCMKMDIEGHEPAALAGMKETLSRNEVLLQIEDYDQDDSKLPGLLTPLGYRHLFRVGSDRYFTNIAEGLDSGEIVSVFEIATESLVQTNLAVLNEFFSKGPAPLRLPFSGLFAIELGGPLASFARSTRNKLLRRRR